MGFGGSVGRSGPAVCGEGLSLNPAVSLGLLAAVSLWLTVHTKLGGFQNLESEQKKKRLKPPRKFTLVAFFIVAGRLKRFRVF